MTPLSQLDSRFFRSMRKMYFTSQICGFASFSYSSANTVYMNPINVFTSVFFNSLIWFLIIGNLTSKLDVPSALPGYETILYYIGLKFFSYYTLLFMWIVVQLLFLARRIICKLVEDMVDLEVAVSPIC